MCHGPVSGTTSTRRNAVVESEPVPVMLTLTVVGLVQPDDSVLLPLRFSERPTIVRAGALPVPWYARFSVK